MAEYGSLATNAFADHTPDDYNFGGSDPQYYPLIFSPVDPALLAPNLEHLSPSLSDPYSQSHVRPPQPRIDTTTHIYQAPALPVDRLISPYNDGLGMSQPSPGLTPSTDSSHLTTPEHSPAIHRQHVGIMSMSHSPISPSISLYEPMVRLVWRVHYSPCSSASSMHLLSRPCPLHNLTIVFPTVPSTLISRSWSSQENNCRLPMGN